MGCGQKAMWDEIEEKEFDDRLRSVQNVGVVKLTQTLIYILEDVQRFQKADLRLTRHEHAMIDSTVRRIRELLYVKE